MIKSAAIKDKLTGKVYVGHNHATIANADDSPQYKYKGTLRNLCFGKFGVQGFVTDTGKFIDRKEAARIALECGQIKRLRYFKTQLDSADINYPEGT